MATKKAPEVQKRANTAAFIILYAAAGFLTFGAVFNANYVPPTPPTRPVECGEKPELLDKNWAAYWSCQDFNIKAQYSGDRGTPITLAAPPAIVAGAAWPLYWGGKIAIEVTKPATNADRLANEIKKSLADLGAKDIRVEVK